MKNIMQIMADAEIELTDEQKAAVEKGVKENYRTLADYDKQGKKVSDVTAERDNYKAQFDEAAKALESFKDMNIDEIINERDVWKQKTEQMDADFKKKLEDAEKNYADQIEARDFNDVLMKAIENEEFTSDFAKNGIVDMIKEKGLKREGDKILGLDDYMTELKTSRKDAFKSNEEQVQTPTYTTPTQSEGSVEAPKRATVPTIW